MGMMLLIYNLHLFWHKCPSESPYRHTSFLLLSRLKDVGGKSEIGRAEFKSLLYQLLTRWLGMNLLTEHQCLH